MEVFATLDHREMINLFLERFRERGEKSSFAALAGMIGVQKPYVSRVMAGEACWSADQAFAISAELRLSADEAEYFALLVEEERTGLEKRRKFIQSKIKEIRRRNLRSRKALKAEAIERNDSVMTEYFVDPYHSLVHVYLSITKFQKNLLHLAETIGLSFSHLQAILGRLEVLGVITYDRARDQVRLIKESIHTPADSSLVHAHQALFRALSLDRFARCPVERKNTYSAVFSGDVSLQETLWAEFLEYLKRVERESKNPRPANEVYYLQFDLFPWAGGKNL